ncbi:hypothetical protein ACWCPM_15020 [Streptomyces sp. NPDC002309]
MAVGQLPVRMREFANYLTSLLAGLDHGTGWCAVFWERDPQGMRACLDGHEVPPWDVVEALFQDLAAEYGAAAAAAEQERARPLHAAALLAYDTRPGGRDALGDRFDAMLREQRYATERLAELGRLLPTATSREAVDAIHLDLAWARDDHTRATARCAELHRRMAELDRRAAGARTPGPGTATSGGPATGPDAVGPGPAPGGAAVGPGAGRAAFVPGSAPEGPFAGRGPGPGAPQGPFAGLDPVSGSAPGPGTDPPGAAPLAGAAHPSAPGAATPTPDPAPRQRKRRRGGARFAGAEQDAAVPAVVPQGAVPALPAPAPAAGRGPRGARFAGAAQEQAVPVEPRRAAEDGAARREAAGLAETLLRLRGEGRTGEAHVLLADAAYGPAAHFPLLAAEMERAGLGADWATLLWEAASLPAGHLVAAADALAGAGRDTDAERILRQGVGRPAYEIGLAVLGLGHEGRHREVRALLDAYVRVRTPEEAARSAGPDPEALVPLLLEAARGVSAERHLDMVHALRVAGLTA